MAVSRVTKARTVTGARATVKVAVEPGYKFCFFANPQGEQKNKICTLAKPLPEH